MTRLDKFNGIMPIIISARTNGCKTIIIPKANEKQASFIDGIDVYVFDTLRQVAEFLRDGVLANHQKVEKNLSDIITQRNYAEDLKYVKGQFAVKRALEIAVVGGHNILPRRQN